MRRIFTTLAPNEAKVLSRHLKVRDDWSTIRLNIMKILQRKKYRLPEYRDLLLATGDCQIIEGNKWHDYYWGVCNGKGENNLGKIIMEIRDELNGQATEQS